MGQLPKYRAFWYGSDVAGGDLWHAVPAPPGRLARPWHRPGRIDVPAPQLLRERCWRRYGWDDDCAACRVSLVVHGPSRTTTFGAARPRWEDATTFVGHVVLWLPDARRLVDVTAEQFPLIRRLSLARWSVGRWR